MKLSFLSIIFAISILSGCASIVGEPTQLLPISSNPEGASIVITDEKGSTIFKGTTPSSVTLHKSDGSYWGGKSFIISITKEGYDTVTIPVSTNANAWYIGGNVIFGGLIGWFIVDPLSGNMYSLSVKEVDASLVQNTQSSLKKDGDLSIVLLDQVPQELRSKLVKIN